MTLGVAGVLAAGAMSGCGSDAGGLETAESTAAMAPAVTQDVALAVEGMT
jgi:hypothetical protein